MSPCPFASMSPDLKNADLCIGVFCQQSQEADPACGLNCDQIPEILPEEVLAKMHAAPKADVPLADVHDITQYDGFIFGFPTRCAPTLENCPIVLGHGAMRPV